MHKKSSILRGFLFAAACGTIAFALRRPIVDLAPPRILDLFLIGIALTSYFFSWIPAVALLAASLVITHLTSPVRLVPLDAATIPDLVRLLLYTGVALASTWAIHRLKAAVVFWRATEETHRIIIQDASDAIAVTDRKLNLLEVNDRMCDLTGYARAELLRLNLRDLTVPSGFADWPAGFDEALVKGRVVVQERRLRRRDSSILLAETSVRMLRDGRVVAIARDITERKRAEQALRESEALTRSVLHSAVDGIITIDEQGSIIAFNPAAEKLFGYSARDVLGENVSLLMPAPWREEHDGYIRRYLETRTPHIIGIGREVLALRKDGTMFPAELAVSEVVLPGRRMFTGIVRDISQRKQAEEAIREAGDTLRAVIETSPLPICVTGLDGVVKSWNRAAERVFGWTAGEAIGRRLPIVPGAEWERFLSALEAARRGDTFAGVERRRQTKAGEPIDISIWNAPLRNRHGETTGILSIFADMTERRRLEEQLRQAQKMEAIGRLAGGVAHDFNNVLTVIAGYGQMLADRMQDVPDALEDVQEILKAAEHAGALTTQLLIFSRHRVVHPQIIDLSAVVEGVQKMLGRVIGEDVVLVTHVSSSVGPVRADASQVEQVILNLAVNARDAMPGGGRLTIETANVELDDGYARKHMGVTPGAYAMLAVSDTGRGMDEETRTRLFEPFFTTKEKGKGTGLGLSTVYGIVKQYNGDIWVYSEPGKGTTFKIYFPLAAEARPEEPAAAEPERETGRGAESVLLVEDEAGVRKLVRNILTEQGYRVVEAADPVAALEICSRDGFDLLLTDVVMPSMSGRDLAERAAAIRPSMRVLYMSGYTDNVVVHHGVAADEVPFLQKPFTPAALVRKVRQVLDGSKSAVP